MPRRQLPETAWWVVLMALAAIHLITAAWAAGDHASFAEHLAPFGPLNGHLIDDYAAASATFGTGFALAIYRPWRTPLLTIALLWTAVHTASHIVAANESATTGPAEAAVLGASTLILAQLVRVAASDDATSRPPGRACSQRAACHAAARQLSRPPLRATSRRLRCTPPTPAWTEGRSPRAPGARFSFRREGVAPRPRPVAIARDDER
jgi:hypothetical protein